MKTLIWKLQFSFLLITNWDFILDNSISIRSSITIWGFWGYGNLLVLSLSAHFLKETKSGMGICSKWGTALLAEDKFVYLIGDFVFELCSVTWVKQK